LCASPRNSHGPSGLAASNRKSVPRRRTVPELPDDRSAPFTLDTARAKVQAAEDAWNSRNPDRVVLACTEGSDWRNRAEFLHGRAAIHDFLVRKWENELDYRLKKEPLGVPLMTRRYASINDAPIAPRSAVSVEPARISRRGVK
jgi:nuclear transport factor 2 (NTF2) superfamily protein